MKNLKKYYKYIPLLLFAVVLFYVGFYFFSAFSIPDSSYNFGKKDKTRLYPNFPIIQKFRAQKNNLNQINIALSNADLRGSDSISVEIKDESCDQNIAKIEKNRFSQQFPIFDRFSFPAITDSQGKIYCLKITYFTDNTTLKKSDYPEILVDAEMLFAEKFENTRPLSNEKAFSLVMRPAYTNGSVLSDLGELNQRISQDKPFFLKGNVLTFIFLAFISLTILLVVIFIV